MPHCWHTCHKSAPVAPKAEEWTRKQGELFYRGGQPVASHHTTLHCILIATAFPSRCFKQETTQSHYAFANFGPFQPKLDSTVNLGVYVRLSFRLHDSKGQRQGGRYWTSVKHTIECPVSLHFCMFCSGKLSVSKMEMGISGQLIMHFNI